MAIKQLPKISDLPEPPDRLVGDQERFDVLTFNSLKAQKKMVNEDLNQTLIPALNEFAVDVNASVDAAKASETSALASKNSAASSAATATTKAGEAAASAKAAKTSETSALASKNAASSSATAAANAQKAAEAARDEAQDLANVGYASESHAGLSKVDGKTTQADAGGVITVKDVAIGGNLEDLASARGQIGDYRTNLPAGTDLNDIISSGTYIVYSGNCTNVPMNGMDGYYVLRVFGDATNPNAAVQKIYSRMGTAGPEWSRRRISDGTWQPWQQLVQTNYIGDGIKISRSKALADGTGGLSIISVPEYEGATASTAGTSGLVPPAAASQRENFLTGGGEYKPALSTGGGVMTGSIQINDPANDIAVAPPANTERGLFLADKKGTIMGGFDVIQRASDNAKWTQIFAKNSEGQFTTLSIDINEDGAGTVNSSSPIQINDVRIGRLFANNVRLISLSGASGNEGLAMRYSPDNGELYMDGRAMHGKADTAGYADTAGSANALGGKAESALSVAYARDSGAMNGKAESALSVNYANSAGQVYLAGSAVQWVVNLSGPQITVPLGGTYNVVCICFNDSGGKGAVKHYPNTAGGTVIPNAPTDYMVAGLCARVA
ncbi:pyocin knob domain-containing protein [Bilophila wadsworthia]|uniref:pyocin knob domain-containing protein n=1 Tax=Bilophila wadsworthia TaxID=35833 RepID=UPI0026763032|nr:pyocin knob domain-containing protein [Bilophila wadsworthia]